MKKISIIVPVYKVEAYLEICLKSIIGQSYTNLEIILIDDGSPDQCPEICESYAKQDERIRVVHQKNRGLAVARNIGLQQITGEYVLFVDSDDFLDINFCSRVIDAAEKDQCDIVVGEVITVDEKDIHVKDECEYSISEYELLNNFQAVKEIISQKRVTGYSWGKLYKKDLLMGIKYPEGKLYEDRFTVHKYFARANRVCFCPGAVVYYRMRSDSITHSLDLRRYYDLLEAEKEVLDFCKEQYPQLVEMEEAYYFGRFVHIWIDFFDSKNKEELKRLVNKMKEIYKEYGKKKNIKKMHKVSFVFIFVMPSFYRWLIHQMKLDRCK